jgi:Flp pilus assembly protein TadG
MLIRKSSSDEACDGQALIEFALVLPLLFLLIVNVVNFGGMLYAWITVANGARAGVQYLVLGGASLGAPAQPSAAQVQTLVRNDLAALPNRASAQICVSSSNSVTVACNTGTAPAGAPPAAGAAEAGVTYVVGAVDVTYTYIPFIAAWGFRGIGIHLTLPPTTIHRQAQMRILQ